MTIWVKTGCAENVIGTGPYMVEEYAYDATLQLKAVQDHHRKTPNVENIIYEPIVEDAVAEAALRTGSIDIAAVDLRNYPTLTEEGFDIIGAGAGSFHSISFSGNYWQNSIYTPDPDDEEVPITLHATVQHHIPWIGDPRRDGFGNPPEGFTSMTRAAHVRQALSFAIDRALIAEVLFSNAAWVNYVYGHDTSTTPTGKTSGTLNTTPKSPDRCSTRLVIRRMRMVSDSRCRSSSASAEATRKSAPPSLACGENSASTCRTGKPSTRPTARA